MEVDDRDDGRVIVIDHEEHSERKPTEHRAADTLGYDREPKRQLLDVAEHFPHCAQEFATQP